MKSLLPYHPRLAAAGLAMLLAALSGLVTGAAAQTSAAPVLSNAQVTEDALVDALAIEPAYADDAASGAGSLRRVIMRNTPPWASSVLRACSPWIR